MPRLVTILCLLLLAGCATVRTPPQVVHAEVGVAFTRAGDVASFADGIADRQSGRRVTIDDPVRVASISKMVTAIGVLKLVDLGELDLSRDVSNYLGWKLRNPNFPDRPITLAMLLAHTSSVREHDDDYVIPLGETLQGALDDPHDWDTQHAPGEGYFAYVNFNYPIIGSVMEMVTGERFDRWMRREVLEPLKIDACFNWPTCSDTALARAVELDAPDGKALKDDLHGARPSCPVFVRDGEPCDLSRWKLGENGALFAPQGGLRISARGLARVGRMLLNGGMIDGVRILSPRSVDTLFAQTWHFDGDNGAIEGGFYCSAGNGTHQIPNAHAGCRDDLGTRGAILAGHAGDAYGLKGGLWLDRRRGRGIAYFVTGVAESAPTAPGSAYSSAEVQAFLRTYALLPR